jgi:hypothetical protein
MLMLPAAINASARIIATLHVRVISRLHSSAATTAVVLKIMV